MLNDILNGIWPEWQIVRQIGDGSFGVVYEAVRRDYQVESSAAIKVISIPQKESEIDSLRSEGLSRDATRTYFQGVVNDFVSEIQLMESFKGVQNIVSVEDYKVVEKTGKIGWDIYIRMELLTPFNSYIRNKTLSEKEVIKLGCDICNALELCAKRNVIHRDIKPENIFINDFGDFKLGDFGIARKLENITGGFSQKGTYSYMAPEIEKSAQYDSSVDIYSLGLVLYRLMNKNRLPFLRTEEQILNPNERVTAIRRRMNGEPLPVPCEASPAMAQVILRACSYDPDQRFSSAADMKYALMSVADGTYRDNADELNKTKTVRKAQQQDSNRNISVLETPKEVHTFGNKKKSNMPKIAAITLAVVVLIGAAIFIMPKFTTGDTNEESIENTGIYSEYDEEQIASVIKKAEILAANENYEGALSKVQNGLITYPESEDLQNKADEYTMLLSAQTKEKTLTDASALTETGDYQSAMALIKNAQDKFGEDKDYEEAYITYQKAYALASAEEYAANDDYPNAISVIADAQKDNTTDKELITAYNSYCDAYISGVVAEADAYLAQNKYDEAITLVNNALKVLPGNEILETKSDDLIKSKPVSLTSIKELNSQRWDWNENLPEDPFGNDYSGGCNYVVFTDVSTEAYAEYRVYQKYGTISGIIAPHADIGSRITGIIQIYADDVLVYTSPAVNQKVDAFDFSIDISNAEYIKIVCKLSDMTFGAPYGKILLSNVQLWPVQF